MQQNTQTKLIIVDPDKCTGCHSCEMACSIKHFEMCGTNYSRIRVHEFRDVNTFIPVMCQACEEPICFKVCPMNARVRLESGAMVTEDYICIGCKACIHACPFGAAIMNPVTSKTMSCDLCNDDELGPWCVKACTMQKALSYVRAGDASKARGREWAKSLTDDYKVPGTKEDDFGFSFNV